MIICHKYRFVFVEFPRTGSTAISAELVENYGGKSILRKHSHYSAFLRIASDEEKQYRIASGIRNPLDDAVSWYEKFRTRDDIGTRQSKSHRKRFRYVRDNDADFGSFLKRFYRLPYDSWTNAHHRHMDQIIRFENLQSDFASLLELVGAEQVRPLPSRNQTVGKKHFEDYYDDTIRDHALFVFGPYMQEWGYQFPHNWGKVSVPKTSRFLYAALRSPRRLYWTYIRQPDAPYGHLFRRLFYSDPTKSSSPSES